MYHKIKAELQIFFILAFVTTILLFWSAILRPANSLAAETMQPLEGTAIAALEFSNRPPGDSSFQSGSPTDPGRSFEPIAPLVVTGAYTYYLPRIPKFPTPTPDPKLFFDDFSDDATDWPDGENSDCSFDYNSNEYRVEVKADSDDEDECFAFAPEDAEHKLGQFEVQARRSDGNNHFDYGIYMNGAGGDEYYLFRVERNGSDCDWEFIRRQDGDSDVKADGACDSITNDDNKQAVTLRIRHASNRVISAFLNGVKLYEFTDNDDLDGEGTGLYVRSYTDNDEVVVRFDNFSVYQP